MESDLSIHILEKITKNTFYKKEPYKKGGFGMQQFQIRTDLALEATESVRKQASGQMRGISIDEYDILDDVHISKVMILSKNAAKSIFFIMILPMYDNFCLLV